MVQFQQIDTLKVSKEIGPNGRMLLFYEGHQFRLRKVNYVFKKLDAVFNIYLCRQRGRGKCMVQIREAISVYPHIYYISNVFKHTHRILKYRRAQNFEEHSTSEPLGPRPFQNSIQSIHKVIPEVITEEKPFGRVYLQIPNIQVVTFKTVEIQVIDSANKETWAHVRNYYAEDDFLIILFSLNVKSLPKKTFSGPIDMRVKLLINDRDKIFINFWSPNVFTYIKESPAKVFEDDRQIFRFKKSNVKQVHKKLVSIIRQKKVKLDESEIEHLVNLRKFLLLKNKKKGSHTLIQVGTFKLIQKLLHRINEKLWFPILDLFRLLVLTPKICTEYVLQNTSFPVHDNPLQYLVHEVVVPNKWDLQVSYPSKLMILRLYCNLFFSDKPKTCTLFSNSAIFSSMVSLILKNLSIMSSSSSTTTTTAPAQNNKKMMDGMRYHAASLSANLSLLVPKKLEKMNLQVSKILEVSVSNILSEQFVHGTKQETNKTNCRILLSFHRLLNGSSVNVKFVKSKFDCALIINSLDEYKGKLISSNAQQQQDLDEDSQKMCRQIDEVKQMIS